jgi:hypothetical protein
LVSLSAAWTVTTTVASKAVPKAGTRDAESAENWAAH